jgi:choline kinase
MSCKQAVLLAAGGGKRLGDLTVHKHKCMVEVAGKPIVDNLCDVLESLGVEELVVVTGHLHDAVVAHLEQTPRAINIRFVRNERYAETNNIYSLWLAREHIAPPFMLLECDVFLEPAVLEPLAQPDRMIVSAYTSDMNGTGVEVSEQGVVTRLVLGRHMAGEDRTKLRKTVNLYSFSAETWSGQLEPAMREYIEAGDLNYFYEAALGRRIDAGTAHMTAVDVTDKKWVEIDTPDDLAAAEALFES